MVKKGQQLREYPLQAVVVINNILYFTYIDFVTPAHCVYLQLQGKSSTQAWSKVRSIFWSALLWNWAVWGCAQYINMSYVPLKVCVPAETKDPKTTCVRCSSQSYLLHVAHILLLYFVCISTFFKYSHFSSSLISTTR